jgi:hypothetical protein
LQDAAQPAWGEIERRAAIRPSCWSSALTNASTSSSTEARCPSGSEDRTVEANEMVAAMKIER